jgi:hypothetical protein
MTDDIIDTYAQVIGPIGLALYAVIARCADKHGACFPSYTYFQKTLHISRGAVAKYLKVLEDAGLIRIEARHASNGERGSNVYTILEPETDTSTPLPSSPERLPSSPERLPSSPERLPPVFKENYPGTPENLPSLPGRLEGLDLRTPTEGHKTENHALTSFERERAREGTSRVRTKASKTPATNYTDGFTRFWESYPIGRKEGKVEAFAIWQTRGLEERADEIAAKIERLLITLWVGRDKTKIPLPTTYLNQARYEDDLVPIEFAQQQAARDRLSDREFRTMRHVHNFIHGDDHDDHGRQGDVQHDAYLIGSRV